MGYYINQINGKPLPSQGKFQSLIENGSTQINTPTEFQDNLVCVVENIWFDAAAYAYSEKEMNEFLDPSDHRRKRWLIVPYADLLSGFNEPV
jgi:hypothetical protein